MRRKPPQPQSSSSESEEDVTPLQKPPKTPKLADDSSSESDIENYLQPIDQIDLNSPFFDIQKNIPSPLDQVEDDVFEPAKETETCEDPSTSKSHFQQLHDYTKKMEEAKKSVDAYKIRKQIEEEQTDVTSLLATAENKSILTELGVDLHSSDSESCSDSEKGAWEEVGDTQNAIPKENLEITVEMPGVIKKKKKEDMVSVIKRRINRIKKLNQVLVHKVHLLGWISHGNYVNAAINSPTILALALSLIPPEPARPTDSNYIEQVVKWYKNCLRNVGKTAPKNKSLEELLEVQIAKKEAYGGAMLVYIFVAVLRSLGVPCRLVLSLQVEPVRPPKSELISLSTKNNKLDKSKNKKTQKSKQLKQNGVSETAKKESSNQKGDARSKGAETQKIESSQKATTRTRKTRASATEKIEPSQGEDETIRKTRSKSTAEAKKTSGLKAEVNGNIRTKSAPNAEEKIEKSKVSGLKKKNESPKVKTERKKSQTQTSSTLITTFLRKTKAKSNAMGKSKKSPRITGRNQNSPKIPQLDGINDESSDDESVTTLKPKLRTRRSVNKLKESSDSEDSTRDTAFHRSANRLGDSKIDDLEKEKEILRKRRSNEDSDYDSDYIPEAKKKHLQNDSPTPIKKVKKTPVKINKNENKKKIQGVDLWVEIYSGTEKRWITVDVIEGQVDCVNKIHAKATPPVSYVLAWNNNNTIKDVTSRYCKNFNTTTRELRIDPKWWTTTLKPFTGPKTLRDQAEDEELERQQLETPLPQTIKEYKNHPLYVLKRHLLKYEAIYPPDTPTIGFLRKEPVFPRQSVYTLHSRDIWLKHAKTVKPGEKPYKIVKARPRWDKLSNKVITGGELEIFGPWQTQDYDPPTAENGVVPRNAFGNVELFKPCMLPKKTVHLKLPGLNKVAKKMNIDCAAAIVGFDFHGGWNHPTYDGYVVCEEDADILVAAWELEQDELDKKEEEKVNKRVYGNWKKLIKGLLIRERLKKKYEFGQTAGGETKKKGKGGLKMSPKKRKIESESESENC